MRFGKLSYGMELLPYRYRLPGNFRRARKNGLYQSSEIEKPVFLFMKTAQCDSLNLP